MGREIKFRAWDVNSRKMFDCSRIEEYSLEQIQRLSSTNDPYTKFMQYTGLKDKNGVEIYSGDKVKWTDLSGDSSTHEVVFKDGMFIFDDIDFEDDEAVGMYRMCKLKNIKVIGNIHQPELLKGESDE